MNKCKHKKIIIEKRSGNKYGLNVRAKCSCGEIASNWHQDERKARIGFHQERDYHYMLYGYTRQWTTPL